MSTHVSARFDQGSEAENNFDTLMDYLSSAWEGPGEYSEDVADEALQTQPKVIQEATREIIQNDWFWMFDSEYSAGCCEDKEGNRIDGVAAFDIHFMLHSKSPEMSQIVLWMKACGARTVVLEEGDVDDEDAGDYFAYIA